MVCTASILYLSLVPVPPTVSTGWDKSNHALAMALTTLIGYRAAKRNRWELHFAFGYTLLLGIAIEVLQECCTLTRSAEWLDLVADLVGSIIMIVLLIGYKDRTAHGRMNSSPPAV